MKLYLRALVFGALVALLNPVWALRAPIVPIPGYEILEYLESSGEQYIDTGIVYASDTKLEQRFCVVNFNGKQMQMGAIDAVPGTDPVVHHRFHWGVKTYNTLQYVAGVGIGGNPGDIIADSDGWVNLSLDATAVGQNYTESGHSSIGLFGRNSGGTFTCGNFRVGQTCIWKGSNLVRNMVPVCRKSDSVLGLYDYCESKFYENEGSGYFVAGPAMKLFNDGKGDP